VSIAIQTSIDLEKRAYSALLTGEFWITNTYSLGCIGTDVECGIDASEIQVALSEKLFPIIKSHILDVSHAATGYDLGHFEFVILGHSVGGGIAQLLALRFYYDPTMKFIKTGGHKNALNQVYLALAANEK
jgi:hypothetical protein